MATEAKKKYTRNEVIAYMHKDRATTLNKLANHFEKLGHGPQEIIKFLREVANESEAESIVVDLRDQL